MGDWVKLSRKERDGLLALPLLDAKVRKKLERANKQITVRSAKQKGQSFQKWLAQEISDIIDEEFGMDDEAPVSSRPGGQHGVDIILRGAAKEKFPFAVEAKNQETLDLVGTINQAEANTPEGQDWLIVHKRKRINNPITIMKWEVFKSLYASLLDIK